MIAFVGCSNYPNGGKEVAEMAKEFLERNYIVLTTGCGAMNIGEYRDEEGKTLYEQYGGEFDARGLVNMGSCVSNSHVVGATIKIANIFAKKNHWKQLRRNCRLHPQPGGSLWSGLGGPQSKSRSNSHWR